MREFVRRCTAARSNFTEEIVKNKEVVFLDRDGTINFDSPDYICRPEQLRLIPGSAQAIAKLKQAGLEVVVVTNQSSIGRGMALDEDVRRTNEKMKADLAAEEEEAVLDAILYCPHAPEDNCGCRKPKTGLVDHYRKTHHFDPFLCWLIGDKIGDLELGWNTGIPFEQCLLVGTGYGEKEAERLRLSGRPVPLLFKNLSEAAQHVLASRIKQAAASGGSV